MVRLALVAALAGNHALGVDVETEVYAKRIDLPQSIRSMVDGRVLKTYSIAWGQPVCPEERILVVLNRVDGLREWFTDGVMILHEDLSPDFEATRATQGLFDFDVHRLTKMPDGRILAHGRSRTVKEPGRHVFLRALRPDLSPDEVFNRNTRPISLQWPESRVLKPDWPEVRFVRGQPDRAVLVAGMFGRWGNVDVPGLVRLRPNGELDRTFMKQLTKRLDASGRKGVQSLIVWNDGRILLGGDFRYRVESDASSPVGSNIARIYPDGRPDQEFLANVGSGCENDISALHVTAAQQIWIVGCYYSYGSRDSPDIDGRPIRLKPTGAVDKIVPKDDPEAAQVRKNLTRRPSAWPKGTACDDFRVNRPHHGDRVRVGARTIYYHCRTCVRSGDGRIVVGGDLRPANYNLFGSVPFLVFVRDPALGYRLDVDYTQLIFDKIVEKTGDDPGLLHATVSSVRIARGQIAASVMCHLHRMGSKAQRLVLPLDDVFRGCQPW